MNELLFKTSLLSLTRKPDLSFSFNSSFSSFKPSLSQNGSSFFSTLLSPSHPSSQSHFLQPVRWATSSTSQGGQQKTTKKDPPRGVLYPELDQPLKKPKKFDPLKNLKKFPDDDFDFDSVRYQKPEDGTVDVEEFEEDEKERQFRRIQRQKAKVYSGRLNTDTDITLKKWTENSYTQLLDALSDQKKNILITKASLLALKNFLQKGEEFVDLQREVYKYGKHKQRDYNFRRNFPHSFSYPVEDDIDHTPMQSESTPIQVKTVLSDSSEDDIEDAEYPFFKLPPTKRLPNGGTYAVGRRKAAIARCLLTEGVGRITVNGRPLDELFRFDDRRTAMRPLTLTETEHFFDLRISLVGGGTTGQADAIKFAISRCILKYDPQYWWVLHGDRLLHGDKRRVEPKKFGRHKARRGNQWVKR